MISQDDRVFLEYENAHTTAIPCLLPPPCWSIFFSVCCCIISFRRLTNFLINERLSVIEVTLRKRNPGEMRQKKIKSSRIVWDEKIKARVVVQSIHKISEHRYISWPYLYVILQKSKITSCWGLLIGRWNCFWKFACQAETHGMALKSVVTQRSFTWCCLELWHLQQSS